MIRDITIILNRFKDKFEFYEFLRNKIECLKIYTDGSKTNSRTSFAFDVYSLAVIISPFILLKF